jgi:hypothetical protein
MSKRQLIVTLGCVLVGALVVWLVWPRQKPDADVSVENEATAPGAAGAPSAPPPRVPARAQPEAPAYKEETVTSDGIPIAPPSGEVTGPAHPHPITPQHQRIYGENRLVGAIEGAMEVKDVAGMRRLLEQYRREYPEDDQELQDGYAAIADCMEHPGAASRATAERWLDSHNGSTAKRYVVKHCLEPAAP